ncbi:MAG: glycosyltransferase family 4 protein [Chitinispirillaceae bacterium]|nr:glycosyltransferase family 4 protein [Chitinispirillaceae bacterium]
MKIAIVNSEHPSPTGNDHGGIATYTYTLAGLLAERGHTVHVLTRSLITPEHYSPSVSFHRYGFTGSANPVARLLQRFHRDPITWEKGHARSVNGIIRELYRKKQVDIADIPEYGGMAACYSSDDDMPPCAITFHTPSSLVDSLNNMHPSEPRRRLYLLEREGITRAAGYKSPSHALKNHVCATYHLPESSVPVIRNPFDFTNQEHLHRQSHPADRFDILFSGRLEHRKGAEVLVQSISRMLAIGAEVTVTIAGETEINNAFNYRHAIERLLAPGERKRVWFPGPLPSVKLQALYANSSVLFFPSLYENCPYVLIEAMAAGLPVVATEGSGISEIVTHNTSGLLFSPGDHSRLLAHIRTLYSDREYALCLGEAGARTVRQLFDPEAVIDATIDFYQLVLHDGNRRT